MNMDIETDAEIVTGLVKKLQDKSTPRDRLLTVLKDLEYYLHQVLSCVVSLTIQPIDSSTIYQAPPHAAYFL